MTALAPMQLADGESETMSTSATGDLSWRAHPARHDPRRTAIVFGVILAVSLACALAGHSILWGSFSALVLALSLEGFLLPTRFALDAKGVVVQRVFSRSAREWSSFRRVYHDRQGLTLSPYSRRTALEPYRSLRLLFDGGDERAIVTRVRESIGEGARWIEVAQR